MRKGHNPNFNQKQLLEECGYNWKEWLVVKTEQNQITFKHKKDGTVILLFPNNEYKR